MNSKSTNEVLLEVKELTVKYKTTVREITALNRVSVRIEPAKILAVVGESGCGKSTLGLAIINLLPKPPALVDSGEISFRGTNLLKLREDEMSTLRGTDISMIFQDPMSSLDPVFAVGEQIAEAIEVRRGHHEKLSYGPYPKVANENAGNVGSLMRLVNIRLPQRKSAVKHDAETLDALKKVNIPDPEQALGKYPHELSGGMAQRVMIAQALVERPSLLIADEPTSALDVTTQAQVLDLIRTLRKDVGSSIIFITHDLAVAAQIADKIAVMYAGEIVEFSDVHEIFTNPLHPYTEGLIRSFPTRYKDQGSLEAITGDVPDLRTPPPGCRFHPRCKYAFDRCTKEHPELIEAKPNHNASCFLRYKS